MLQGQRPDIKTGGDFEPVPSDRYTVLIVDVNLVQQKKFQSVELEDALNYQFAILDEKEMPKIEGKESTTTRGRFLWKRCRLALNDRSWLGKLAKAAVGRNLTKEERESFDPESVVGSQLAVMVEQQESKDGQRIYNNILSFEKVSKRLEPVKFEAKDTGVVEKETVPAEAPKTKDEVDSFVGSLEKEKAEKESEAEEEQSVEELELQLKLAKAKAKSAKAAAKK